jgi:hypothetical protein
MAEWVPSVSQLRVLQLIPFVLLLAGIGIWREVKLRNYTQTTVIVEQVEQLCHPPPTALKFGIEWRFSLRPCSDFPDDGRRYLDVANARTSFHYRSPVDRQMHMGHLL